MSSSSQIRASLYLIIVYAFIILLFYAAVSKLIEYPQFYNDLLNSPVFGNEHLAVLVFWAVPLAELTIAGLLISTSYRKLGVYLASGLISLFTLYIIWVLVFSENIPCSCGGIISNFSWQEHLIFNTIFVFLGAFGIYLQIKKRKRVFIK